MRKRREDKEEEDGDGSDCDVIIIIIIIVVVVIDILIFIKDMNISFIAAVGVSLYLIPLLPGITVNHDGKRFSIPVFKAHAFRLSRKYMTADLFFL